MTIKAQMHGGKFKVHCIRCGGTNFEPTEYDNPNHPHWYECKTCGLNLRSDSKCAFYSREEDITEGLISGSNLIHLLEMPPKHYNPLDDHEGALERAEWLENYIKANQPKLCENDENMKCMFSKFATNCVSKCPFDVLEQLGVFRSMIKNWRKHESRK